MYKLAEMSTPKIPASSIPTELRPIPDPTILTTQQIYTAIGALRDVIEVRLDGMDKAVQLLQEAANRKPTIGELEAKFDAKIEQIGTIFTERAHASTDSRLASSAAIAKAEAATNEALRQLQALFQTSIGALSTQVQDVKSRLDRGEGDNAGQREARGNDRTTHLDSRALVFSIVASVTALGIVLVGLLNFAKLH